MNASTEASRKQSGPAALNYVRHQTRTPAPKWELGLDLGQRRDHTSITVLDLAWIERGRCPITFGWLFEPQLTLRGLERVPLGTCYEDIHLIIADKIDILEKRITEDTNRAAPTCELIIDAGGPGPPMVDRLRRTLKSSIAITPGHHHRRQGSELTHRRLRRHTAPDHRNPVNPDDLLPDHPLSKGPDRLERIHGGDARTQWREHAAGEWRRPR